MVARNPVLWPKQVTLIAPAVFPIVINGQNAGEVKAPVGTVLRLLRVGAQQVEVEYQNGRHLIPLASTDLMPRALATFRAMGSTLSVATPPPVAATTVAPAATPAGSPPPLGDKLKIEVTVERKRLDAVRAAGTEGNAMTTTDKYNYVIKVQSREFADVPPLDVEYVIFVERQKIGTKKDADTIERITGKTKTEVLTKKTAAQSMSTSEIVVHKASIRQGLDTTYSYTSGGRLKVEDDILGVWVKIFREGHVVAEIANPSTVKSRGWQGKGG